MGSSTATDGGRADGFELEAWILNVFRDLSVFIRARVCLTSNGYHSDRGASSSSTLAICVLF
jgi:hypothetical protein